MRAHWRQSRQPQRRFHRLSFDANSAHGFVDFDIGHFNVILKAGTARFPTNKYQPISSYINMGGSYSFFEKMWYYMVLPCITHREWTKDRHGQAFSSELHGSSFPDFIGASADAASVWVAWRRDPTRLKIIFVIAFCRAYDIKWP